MQKVSKDEPDRVPSSASVRRSLADAVGAEHVAVNYYELEPGESFAFGYHSHARQEELFYVLDGAATFETEDGDVEVAAGELVRFAPGERQRGWNRGEERVLALALGSPRDPGGGELFRDCPDCGERTPHGFDRDDEGAILLVCEECGARTGRYTA